MISELSKHERTAEWMDLRALQQYASVCERTLREWIHLTINPLPASQVEHGKILVKRSQFDSWLQARPIQSVDSMDINCIADEIVNELRRAA
jgi:hypothetical protein